MLSRTHFAFLINCLLVSVVPSAEPATVTINYEYREGFNFERMLDAAIQNVESEVKTDPDNAKLRSVLATLYYQTDKISEGKQQLEAIIKLHPDDADAYFHLGILYLDEQDYVRCKEHMEKAIRLNPLHVQAYNSLARMYILTEQYDQAKQVWDMAKRRKSDEESFYFNQSLLLLGHYKDQWDTIITNMKAAIRLARKEEYFFILGLAEMELQRYEAVRSAMNEVLKLNPKNALALLLMAETHKRENDFAQALAIAKQAREISPDNRDIHAGIQEYEQEYKKWKERNR